VSALPEHAADIRHRMTESDFGNLLAKTNRPSDAEQAYAKAADGYDKNNGYDDIAHTVAFGKQVKDAGMGLLIDFHYSDNWADPGKQCVPVAWQGYTTIAQMATALHDYTKDAITKLVAQSTLAGMTVATAISLLIFCGAMGKTGQVPVIGISGRGESGEEAAARAAGMNFYFVKPVSPSRLAQALAALSR